MKIREQNIPYWKFRHVERSCWNRGFWRSGGEALQVQFWRHSSWSFRLKKKVTIRLQLGSVHAVNRSSESILALCPSLHARCRHCAPTVKLRRPEGELTRDAWRKQIGDVSNYAQGRPPGASLRTVRVFGYARWTNGWVSGSSELADAIRLSS